MFHFTYYIKHIERIKHLKTITIATHNGSTVHQAHNLRVPQCASKQPHINPNGIHETWKHEPVRQAYHRLFDESVKEHNNLQRRSDRKINNYYNKVNDSPIQHPAYEMIIGIYGKDKNGVQQCPDELGKQILQEFVDTWESRNASLELIGAYYHADEEGEPHVHIDYIPVAKGYTRGMKIRTGLTKALESMGFVKQGKATSQIQWEARENAYLTELCEKQGFTVLHPRYENTKHLDTQTYKAQKELENILKHTQNLVEINNELETKISKLKDINNAKTTGIIKYFDETGNIEIPDDVKKKAFGRRETTTNIPMEILYMENGTIILKPVLEPTLTTKDAY